MGGRTSREAKEGLHVMPKTHGGAFWKKETPTNPAFCLVIRREVQHKGIGIMLAIVLRTCDSLMSQEAGYW